MSDGLTPLSAYDGVAVQTLGASAGAASLLALAHCTSTMDVAHAQAAAGAPHGSVVVAEQQGAGRGRTGKAWVSPAGAGVWASVVLRPPQATSGGVLSLRVGLELAERLDALTGADIQLKWPNDLYLGDGKLAGTLVEARWRGDQLEWIVVGVGVNVRPPVLDVATAALPERVRCADVLMAVVQSVLAAGAGAPTLSEGELTRYAARDFAIGRAIVSPLGGTVEGITATGALRVRTHDGEATAVAGSLVFRTL